MNFDSPSPYRDLLVSVLGQWLVLSPVLLVLLGGLGVSLYFWRRFPRPAGLAFAALLVLLLLALCQPITTMVLIRMQATHAWSAAEVGLRLSVAGVFFSLLHALAYALLVAAAFSGRVASPAIPPAYPFPPTDPRIP